jgi:carbon-monoxide dehydrogenase medium subunit
MKNFAFLDPTTVAEAVSLLAEHKDEVKVLAGGQSLLVLLKQGLVAPTYLVNIKNVSELKGIKAQPDGGLRLGALTTHAEVLNSPIIREKYPLLPEMAVKVGSVQVRNAGTVGGNLAHSEPAADPPPVLLALDGRVKAVGPNGEREIPLSTLFVDFYETVLAADELLTEVILPPLPEGAKGAYFKFARKKAVAFAMVSVAAIVSLSDGKIDDVRLGLGGVGQTPLRATDAEELLKGKPLDEKVLAEAASAVMSVVNPVSDVHASAEYKREMAGVFTKRAVREAAARARADK